MTQTARRFTGLLAVVGIIVLLVAPPIVLLAIGASPIPQFPIDWGDISTRLRSPDDGSFALVVLRYVAWVCWLYVAISLGTELVAALRGASAPRLRGFRPSQALARGLVAAAALLFVSAPIATAAPAHADVSASTEVDQAEPPPPQETHTPAAGLVVEVARGDTLWSLAEHHLGNPRRYPEIIAANPSLRRDAAGFIHPGQHLVIPVATPEHGAIIVRPGDTLRTLAQQHLGDPERFKEIFDANRNRVQPDGGRLTDPDDIEPGWHLNLPATDQSTTIEEQQVGFPDTPVAMDPVSPPPVVAQPVSPSLSTDVPVVTAAEPSEDTREDQWPTWTTFGVGLVLATGFITWLKRRRRVQTRRRRPERPTPMPEGVAVRVEQELQAVANPDLLEQIDFALQELSAHFTTASRPIPRLRAARMLGNLLELFFVDPQHLSPPWTPTTHATIWHIDLARVTSPPAGAIRPYPALVTIGQDEEGAQVLLDLEFVGALAVRGKQDDIRTVMAAMTFELATSPWAQHARLTVVSSFVDLADAFEAGRIRYVPTAMSILSELEKRALDDRLALDSAGVTDLQHARATRSVHDAWQPEIIILVGPVTPSMLKRITILVSELPRVALAVVTNDIEIGQWQLRLSSGAERAVLQPLGLDLEPQRLTGENYNAMAEIAVLSDVFLQKMEEEGPFNEPTLSQVSQTPPVVEQQVDLPAAQQQEPPDNGDSPMIRLLGEPTVTHAAGHCDPDNHARLVELAAYIALNPGATDETIRHALFPGRHARDLTAQLQNMVGQLRSWLGQSPTGEDYLPRHQENSYRFSNGVRIDLTDWDGLLAEVVSHTSTDNLEAALALVTDKPLTNTHPRSYAWAAPLIQRLNDRIVDVAYELGRRRLMEGRWQAAERAIHTGLDIEPAQEGLWRLRILAAVESQDLVAQQEVVDQYLTLTEQLDYSLDPTTLRLIEEVSRAVGS